MSFSGKIRANIAIYQAVEGRSRNSNCLPLIAVVRLHGMAAIRFGALADKLHRIH